METQRNLTMLTDFYEITMSNGYFKYGLTEKTAVFDMFFRKIPDEGGFALFAGLEQLIDYLKNLRFTPEDIAYLRGKGQFSEEFLRYLESMLAEEEIHLIQEIMGYLLLPVNKAQKSFVFVGAPNAGKSTLLRAIAGIWPYGTGEISLPTGWRTMFLPQRPYLPLGSLRRAIYYPQPVLENTDDNLTGLLERFGLQNLAGQLDAVDDWSRILSLGEQQRLAFIRILLLRPDIVFLDESTSALDELREAQAYEILHQLLPQMAVVSVGHRSSLLNCHDKQLVLAGDGYWKLQDIK